MSNFMEYKNKIAFHPGYYIKEIVDASGLTQEDYAKRLGTTPKNLSDLIRGEQRLSFEMASKLSRMQGSSVNYWMNLQSTYDSLIAEFNSDKELKREREIFSYLSYAYFRKNFGLPDLSHRVEDQIKEVRKFLAVATLSVFAKRDMTVSFRSADTGMTEGNIVKANVMVQIAMNEALKIDAPKFNRKMFERVADQALEMTACHGSFYPQLKEEFRKAGVKFIILPNIPGSKTNGATKKMRDNVLLMVNDRRRNSDTFWFTLFHEIGHIINGDYGISFENEIGDQEDAANKFAQDKLIPPAAYQNFLSDGKFDRESIQDFAENINRDPAIVLGRLQKDGILGFDDKLTASLRHKYKVRICR